LQQQASEGRRPHPKAPATRLATASLCIFLLAGCAAQAPKYLQQPAPVAAQGDWRLEPSGMVFPAELAGFQRVTVARVSQTQPDAAVSYNLTGEAGPMAATLYLSRAPILPTVGLSPDAVAGARARACRAEFETAKRDISALHATRLLEERTVSLRKNARLRRGRLAVLAYPANFAGRRQPLRTDLADFCFAGDDWSLQFQFTYPEGLDGETRLAAFLQALAWTGQLAD